MRRHLVLLMVAILWTGCEGYDAAEVELDTELLGQVSTSKDAGRSVDAGAGRGGGALGSTCTADADCAGTGAKCLTNILSFSIPGGLCTQSCRTDSQCGAGGACPFAAMIDLAKRFMPDAGLTDSMSVCMRTCKSASDCRAGYTCAALPAIPLVPAPANGAKLCMPPTPDGGVPRPDGGRLPGFSPGVR